MLTLECPNCHSCFTVQQWNESPHRGDTIPEDLESREDFAKWDINSSGGLYDCPECGEVAVTGDMMVV